LSAYARDEDGWPRPRGRPLGSDRIAKGAPLGLRATWMVYRGPGDQVVFDPEQDERVNAPWSRAWADGPPYPPVPADGKVRVTVRFGAPGSYVLRVLAHDGALATIKDVTVTVDPPVPTPSHRSR
jgi:hypothetical protein